jgi:hypothetical protein
VRVYRPTDVAIILIHICPFCGSCILSHASILAAAAGISQILCDAAPTSSLVKGTLGLCSIMSSDEISLSTYPTIDILKKNCAENKIILEDDASIEINFSTFIFLKGRK